MVHPPWGNGFALPAAMGSSGREGEFVGPDGPDRRDGPDGLDGRDGLADQASWMSTPRMIFPSCRSW